jgi:hypothetical protein
LLDLQANIGINDHLVIANGLQKDYLTLSLCQLHEQVATSVCAVGCIKDTNLQLNNGSMVCIHTFRQKLGVKFCSKKNRLLPGGIRKELHTSRMMQYTAHALCTRHVFQISI